MSDYQSLSKSLKEALSTFQVPSQLDLKLFGNDVLDSTIREEAALFGVQNADIDLNKRQLKYSFTEPLFAETIRVHLSSSLSTKSFKLQFFGADKDLELSAFTNGMLNDAVIEIKVGCFIKGFEISTNKQIKKIVKGIEVLGFDKLSFIQNLAIARGTGPTLADIKNRLTIQISNLDNAFNDLQEKQNQLADIDTQIASRTATNKGLREEIENLESTIFQKKLEIDTQKDSLIQITKQQEDAVQVTKEAKDELEATRTSIRDEQRNLNALLEKKSFYNETLVGHKKETVKNIRLNAVLMAGMTYVLYKLIDFVMLFYKDTISQVTTIEKTEHLIAVVLLRVGAGVLFFFVFRYCFRVLSQMFARTYQLVTDIRNIEGKLVIARAVAESALKAGDFNSEEKRNFSAAVAFYVMKNHFLSMSHESIVDDLEVDEDEVEKVIPRLPANQVAQFLPAQSPSPNAKSPEAVQ